MNISRCFLIIGACYLLLGVALGGHMGASGDHTLASLHAHINLLGFTLMTIFGLAYRLIAPMAASAYAKVHFWLHQIGVLGLLSGLYLLFSGKMAQDTLGPILALMEGMIFIGLLCWLIGLVKYAR